MSVSFKGFECALLARRISDATSVSVRVTVKTMNSGTVVTAPRVTPPSSADRVMIMCVLTLSKIMKTGFILARNAGLLNVMTAHRFCTIAICVSDGSVPRASNRMERNGSISRKTTWHVALLPLQKCQAI